MTVTSDTIYDEDRLDGFRSEQVPFVADVGEARWDLVLFYCVIEMSNIFAAVVMHCTHFPSRLVPGTRFTRIAGHDIECFWHNTRGCGGVGVNTPLGELRTEIHVVRIREEATC